MVRVKGPESSLCMRRLTGLRRRRLPPSTTARCARSVFLGIAVCWSPGLRAQASPSLTIQDAHAGDCQVIVRINDRDAVPVGTPIHLELNHGTLLGQIAGTNDRLTFPVFGALQEGDRLRVHREYSPVRPDVFAKASRRGPPAANECGTLDAPAAGETYDAQLFVGGLVNNFFPGSRRSMDMATLGDPSQHHDETIDENGGKNTVLLRWIVQARLYSRFLVEGEAAFAGRSACTGAECLQPEVQREILHTARSFEAFLAPRLRVWTFQEPSTSPIDLYAIYRIGALGIVDRVRLFCVECYLTHS